MSTDKKITVSEFRFWLQGVEEMQPEGWTPDSRQWAKIREKIDQITEAEQPARPPLQYPQGVREARPAPTQGANVPPSIPVPVGPSNLQSQPQIPRGPKTATTRTGLPVSLSSGPQQMPLRTPDIDTSSGDYDSQFV